MSSTFDDNLDDLDDEYENAEPEQRTDFGPMMRDGQQQALLVALELRTRQSDDHRQLYLKFQNRTGSVRDWRDLDAENGVGLKIAKGDLTMLGFEGKLSQLPAWLASGEWQNMVCNINKKTKPGDTKDFVDVYLNGVVGKVEDASIFDVDPSAVSFQPSGTAAGEQFAGADDDIPFAPTMMSSGCWGV